MPKKKEPVVEVPLSDVDFLKRLEKRSDDAIASFQQARAFREEGRMFYRKARLTLIACLGILVAALAVTNLGLM